ncbi:MAG: hypothetical protein MUF78_02280 [Candidatus Edwardsbacteria bacterium]|jgi:hypothetical protein|nr:hypothetical protein [Candidatus Edwardsbacteria bacterium]
MLAILALIAALAAPPAAPVPRPATQAAARDTAVAGRAVPRLSRRNCTLNYYHYKLLGMHVAGGYSLNLPLTVFIEDDPGDAARESSVFQMPLLPDVNIGYQSKGRAFFVSWLKRFQRPRVQLYFKVWF